VTDVERLLTVLTDTGVGLRDLAGLDCRFVDLPTLIRLKRAAGRPKDLECIAALEALWQETPRQGSR
jgi:hypothetical protein